MAHVRGKNYKPTATVVFDDHILSAIEDYRFESRKENRSQAVNELIKFGLRYLELREKKRKKLELIRG